MSKSVKPIPKRELLAYRADVKGSIFRQVRKVFAQLKDGGFTQKDLAAKIDMDEGQLSRRLRGDHDLQLDTFSDLARGLDCRIDVKLTPLVEAVRVNQEIRPITDQANDNSPTRKLGRSAATRDDPQDTNRPRIVVSAN